MLVALITRELFVIGTYFISMNNFEFYLNSSIELHSYA